MTIPRATLRLQFHRGFTFADAARLVGYFASLGISHVYSSPIMTARAGSPHGYDTVDPTRISAELGGEEGFRHLVRILRDHGMGIILDIVPNHMAVGKDNPWWMDVLTYGRTSHYAKFFDIDWEPPNLYLRGKVLLPVLGKPYGEALAAGEITIGLKDSRAFVSYFDHAFPLSGNVSPAAFTSDSTNRERLHELLEDQYYRLSWWRSANDEINWRRFFDINELAALRMEVDEVFETVHAEIFRLYREGLIDGVRVDHIDGLAQPGAYCRKLRKRLSDLEATRPPDTPKGPAYLIVEKILSGGEALRAAWETDGTTGYDFMDEINAVQHDPTGEATLTALWSHVSDQRGDFETEEQLARRQILDRSFSAQRESLVRAIFGAAQNQLTTRDIPWTAIRRTLTEILVHFPVYRIYSRADQVTESDVAYLEKAVAGAKKSCLPSDVWLVETLAAWLAGAPIRNGNDPLQNLALIRFQQLSTSLCAKAVEDTAFYRYGRLISRNDVGFDIRRFSTTVDEFHDAMRRRKNAFPHAMLATATHDHKRGEDVRARLAVLSERSEEWATAAERWIAAIADLCVKGEDGAIMPSRADIAILLQTLVGAWPPILTTTDTSGLTAYAMRLVGWQTKALREAKLHSDWAAVNEAYERAATNVIARLFADRRDLLSELAGFANGIMAAGAINSLAQTLIKLTAPGVPDLYQGTEYWDFSLVDPDNRTPIDFGMRQSSLDQPDSNRLLAEWRDGRLKQYVVARALASRKDHADAFSEGDYIPLRVSGPMSQHVLAFARRSAHACVIVVAPRCIAHMLTDDGRLSYRIDSWNDVRLEIPLDLQGAYRNPLSEERHSIASDIGIGELFGRLPIALLIKTSAAVPL
jgi:(1->4)-alpha-D-glucan 1-alpha-D-glucosylmutase